MRWSNNACNTARLMLITLGAATAVQCSRGYEPADTVIPAVSTRPAAATQPMTASGPARRSSDE